MRRIDKYKTVKEADKAFQQFCDDHDCEVTSSIYDCPYVSRKEKCQLCWAMEEVDSEKN